MGSGISDTLMKLTSQVRGKSMRKRVVRSRLWWMEKAEILDVLGRKGINISNSQTPKCSKEEYIKTAETNAFMEQMGCFH